MARVSVALALAVYVVIAFMLWGSHGMYSSHVLWFGGALLGGLGAVTAVAFRRAKPGAARKALSPWVGWAVAAVLVARLTQGNPLLYRLDIGPHGFYYLPLWPALLALVGAAEAMARRPRWTSRLLVVACVALVAQEAVVCIISPKPFIDVFVNDTAAVDFFLRGLNPYTQRYVDIYHGGFDYHPGFLYFPGPLLAMAPFRAVLGDIRFAMVFAQGLSAYFLFSSARRLKCPEPWPALLSLLWLAFLVSPFVIEQAWIDPLLVAAAAAAFWATLEQRDVATGLSLGALVALKQYGIALAGILWLWGLRRDGSRAAIRRMGVGAVAAAAAIVPFAAADFDAFVRSTVSSQADSAPRLDALNFTAYALRNWAWHWPVPGLFALSLAGLAFATLALARARKERVQGLAFAASALALGLAQAFFFGKWAFCNYYYLVAAFIPWICAGFLGKDQVKSHGTR